METFEVKIINPKATQVLRGLEAMKLISIKDPKKELASLLEKHPAKKEGLHTGKIKDTYPFTPQYLTFNGHDYILREKLNTSISFEEGHYIIRNELLDITVWGETRDEAEEAFAFTFHSLYENFAKENDKKLTPQARRLKQTLKNLIVKEK